MIFLRSLQRFQVCKQTNFLRKGARQGIDPKSSAVVVDKQLEREIQKREFKQRKKMLSFNQQSYSHSIRVKFPTAGEREPVI